MSEDVKELLRAKIPCEETGIEIRHSVCDICTPGPQCGLDVYVKDGKVIKVEGTKGFGPNNGSLCTKGAANRQYLYRKDRIQHPMKRVGPRGSDEFEPITWEEAFRLIAEGLNNVKEKYGADAVAFMTGYPKWYRPWLHRLAFSFGTENYMTESSTCHTAEVMSYLLAFGDEMNADMAGGPDLLVGWSANHMISKFPSGRSFFNYMEKGGRVVNIDTRVTPNQQKADIMITIKSGTDGYLANTIAAIMIKNDWIDKEFIDNYVHGFEEYKAMVSEYTVEECERITGVPAETINELARLIGEAKNPLIMPSNGLCHHINGLQTHRAVVALNILKGNVARKGGMNPSYGSWLEMSAGFVTKEEEFLNDVRPTGNKPRIGSARFPVWAELKDECQLMDFVRQAESGDPYPLKAIYGHGINTMIHPQSDKFVEAAKQMEFIAATDIFWTEFCSLADVVLPACTSLERSEVKANGNGCIFYSSPAVEPLYESRDDVAIIAGVAKALNLDDDLLKSGYDACIKHIFRETPVDLDQAKAAAKQVPVERVQREPFLSKPLKTPSGKIELYSEVIAKYAASHNLDPLPKWYSGFGEESPEEFPFTLISGGRQANAIHSHLHKVPWLRSLRPEVMADINPLDASHLNIKQGDDIYLISAVNKIKVKANLSAIALQGQVNLYHGYEEANVNLLLSNTFLDPYSGFPGFKQLRCRIEKAEVES